MPRAATQPTTSGRSIPIQPPAPTALMIPDTLDEDLPKSLLLQISLGTTNASHMQNARKTNNLSTTANPRESSTPPPAASVTHVLDRRSMERRKLYAEETPQNRKKKDAVCRDLATYADGNDNLATLMPRKYIPRAYRGPSPLHQPEIVQLIDPKNWRWSFLQNLIRVIEASGRDKGKFMVAMRRQVHQRFGRGRGPRELTSQDLEAIVKKLEADY